jgi:phage terminase large subunit-like protein
MGEFQGKPFRLMPYQELLLSRAIFGWRRAGDGTRRFRKVFVFLPKGAGKTPWGAGTAIYLTVCDNEPAAEVYICAGDKEQARVLHNDAKNMIEDSQELDNMFEVLKDTIFDQATSSSLRVLSSDASTKHGFRPHGVVFDEFHAQKNRNLFEALSKSLVKRRQPLMILISHAGDDDEGICFEEYELAKSVLSGTSPIEEFLPVIFEASPEDDFKSPDTWRKANPAHGVLVKHDAIAAACVEAIAEPRKRNDFLRFHLNRWVNQAIAWLPVDWWDRCKGTIDETFLRTLPVAGGLDLAQKFDLAAFVLTFLELLPGPAEEIQVTTTEGDEPVIRKVSLNFRIHVVPTFWLPEATLRERVQADRVPYDQWREAGLLKVTEGDVIDYEAILKEITGPLTARFPRLRGAEIGFDPAFATDLAIRLAGKGYQTVEILQNYKHMSEPAHILEALIKGGRVNHDGHRILRWNIENVAVKRDDAGRIRPVKPKRTAKRIDGVVAAIMGTSRLVLQPAAASPQIHIMHDRPEDAGTPELRNDYSTEEDDPWNW